MDNNLVDKFKDDLLRELEGVVSPQYSPDYSFKWIMGQLTDEVLIALLKQRGYIVYDEKEFFEVRHAAYGNGHSDGYMRGYQVGYDDGSDRHDYTYDDTPDRD